MEQRRNIEPVAHVVVGLHCRNQHVAHRDLELRSGHGQRIQRNKPQRNTLFVGPFQNGLFFADLFANNRRLIKTRLEGGAFLAHSINDRLLGFDLDQLEPIAQHASIRETAFPDLEFIPVRIPQRHELHFVQKPQRASVRPRHIGSLHLQHVPTGHQVPHPSELIDEILLGRSALIGRHHAINPAPLPGNLAIERCDCLVQHRIIGSFGHVSASWGRYHDARHATLNKDPMVDVGLRRSPERMRAVRRRFSSSLPR